MFELTVSTTLERQHYINLLHKNLSEEIKADGGLVAVQNHNARSSLALAVPKNKKEFYKAKILQFVEFMIIDDYKSNFFKESIIVYEENIIFESFVKAISIFDADIDKEFIRSQINLEKEILVDSFYFFKLQPLRSRWARTANIINQNQILQSKSSMLEVLKYLTAMSENGAIETDVSISPKQIKLKSHVSNKCFKRNFDGCSQFLTELIKLNPVKINLKLSSTAGDDGSNEFVETLNKIFCDKIYINS